MVDVIKFRPIIYHKTGINTVANEYVDGELF